MAGLRFQMQQAAFRYGLAEGDNPHLVPMGTLVTCENGWWTKTGRIEKRLGTTPYVLTLTSGGSLAAGARIFSRGEELCVTDGTSLYGYVTAATAWKSVGRIPNVGLTWKTSLDPVSGAQAWDMALSAAGYRVEAWTSQATGSTVGGPLFCRVVEHATGTVVFGPVRIVATASLGVRVLTIGTTAIIVTRQTTANIVAYTINLSTFAFGTFGNLRTDAAAIDGVEGWDTCVIGDNFVIAYSTVTPELKLYSYDTALVQQATGAITSPSGACHVSIDGADGEVLYVLFQDGAAAPSAISLAIADPTTLVETVAPVTVETCAAGGKAAYMGVCRLDATNCSLSYTLNDPAGTYANYRTTSFKASDAAVVATLTQRITWGTYATSRPFVLAGSAYLLLSDYLQSTVATESTPLDGITVIAEVQTTNGSGVPGVHRIVGTIDMSIGGLMYTTSGQPLNGVAAVSATEMLVQSPFQAQVGAVVRTGLRIASVTTGESIPADMWRSTRYAGEAFVSCGTFTAYDGNAAFDYGFPRAPAFDDATPVNGAGAMALGAYLYAAHLEFRSANLLYRSQVQTANATLTGTDDTVNIDAVGYGVTNKQNDTTNYGSASATPVLLPWYRSTVGGVVYYRLTAEPYANVTYPSAITGVASFVDLRADSDIGDSYATDLNTRPALYTEDGALPDYQPPGSVTHFNHADRLWSLAGDEQTWWYSKRFSDDIGVAPGFNPAFRYAFEERQIGGASLEDKAVFFSATGIQYVVGIGPDANGGANDFQGPFKIQTDVGCTSARGIVSMPSGIMFPSSRGIYTLTRNLELQWTGRAVKDVLAAFPVVTSAVLVAKRNQVRFTCNESDGSNGAVLIYDYVFGQWSTAKYTHGATYGVAIVDACMHDGDWHFLVSDGTVYRESSASYLDAGATWVPLTLETAWISAAGPLEFHSVRRMELTGISNTNHDLTISVGFDDDTNYPQTVTYLAGTPVTAVGPLEECVTTIGTRRKCMRIRFKIQDATPTTPVTYPVTTGQGPSFEFIGIEYGVKRGMDFPATKKG